MIDGIVELLGTGALGTFFGGVTGALSKLSHEYIEHIKLKAEYEHVLDMQKLQNAQEKLMAEQKLLEIESQGSFDVLTETIKAETALHTGVSQDVADARASFRMRITMFLWFLVAILIPTSFFIPIEMLAQENPYFARVLDAVLFAATSFAGMWSGAKAVTSRHA